MTNKEFFKVVNNMAQINLEKANTMIETFNLLNGTAYYLNCSRVVYTRYDEEGKKHIHDAWVNA